MTRRNKGEKTIMSKTKKPEASKKVCLRDGCGKPAMCRGLCHSDYQVLLALVKSQKRTWKELEEAGCCLGVGEACRTGAMRKWADMKLAKKS